MVDVQFNEFDSGGGLQPAYYASAQAGRESFFMRMAKKMGAKDDTQANKILLGVGISFFLLSFIVFYFQLREPASPTSPASMNIPGGPVDSFNDF